jgi:hypothetical protein
MLIASPMPNDSLQVEGIAALGARRNAGAVAALLACHAALVLRWHAEPLPTPGPAEDLAALVEAQHAANFGIWHEEDIVRRPGTPDAAIVAAKRAIDRLNQRRNDLIERLDDALLLRLPRPGAGLRMHSETPGMIVDRLSILALRRYHMEEAALRPGADAAHVTRCLERLGMIDAQLAHLSEALALLLDEMAEGRLGFRVFRAIKMYNDPTLRPA